MSSQAQHKIKLPTFNAYAVVCKKDEPKENTKRMREYFHKLIDAAFDGNKEAQKIFPGGWDRNGREMIEQQTNIMSEADDHEQEHQTCKVQMPHDFRIR